MQVTEYRKAVEDERCLVDEDGTIIGVRGFPLKHNLSGDGYYTVNIGGKTRKIARVVAKLTDDAVRLIRTLLENGWTQVQVADRFGITQGNVSAIKRGASW